MSASWFRNLAGWVVPIIFIGVVVFSLRGPIAAWLRGAEPFDEEAMREWIREARVESTTMPELTRAYLDMIRRETELQAQVAAAVSEAERARLANDLRAHEQRLDIKREEVEVFLKSLGNPLTRIYRGQLPLFPLVYRLSIQFDPRLKLAAIDWDSQLPREANQYRELKESLAPEAWVSLQYHLHAYHQVQAKERQDAIRRLLVGGLSLVVGLVGVIWFVVFQRRQRNRDRQRLLAEQQAGEAERRRLQEELRRQEAERRHEEAERQNLELKSQLFANIGIMAGSYAHNIKNLLVRPNDLLRRCLEERPAGAEQDHMIREVKETLGTVTERLQQILQTVRRDPSKSETTRIDLSAVVAEMHRTWSDLARDKWKMTLSLDVEIDRLTKKPTPLWIEGDLSHIQQAIENLLFNARDATFEMRNLLRDKARAENGSEADKRQALLAAAAWKGAVALRVSRAGDQVVMEVTDNGIGMNDDVRQNCMKPHFSTKRDNALFAGLSAGMGLGLSFVSVILAHHRAKLEIDSQPNHGASFRIYFPAAA